MNYIAIAFPNEIPSFDEIKYNIFIFLTNHRFPKHRYFISEYSSIPCLDPSRPRPDSLIPPKAASGALIIPSLIPTIPTSNFLATRQHCRTSFE